MQPTFVVKTRQGTIPMKASIRLLDTLHDVIAGEIENTVCWSEPILYSSAMLTSRHNYPKVADV